ncbi:MAG: tetratricopeptide repeat protein [Bacteroidetes bacterium]|nr:tetratricopeptide repeat protein [Bacteroidota bacterium]
MSIYRRICTIIFFAFISATSSAQDKKAMASEIGENAMKMLEDGKIDEAIVQLTKAEKLDPADYHYPYEIGYAYQMKNDYPKALEELKKVVKFRDADDLCYQFLGNLYDQAGDTTKAFAAYKAGLKKFPNSGRLYMEQGNIYFTHHEYEKAVYYYENGIDKDPTFSSNYYRAAIIFLDGDEKVWGMLYGELFINLERNTDRTRSMSKLLYDNYQSQVKKVNDTAMSISFSKVNTVYVDKNGKAGNLPFGVTVYEPLMLTGFAMADAIDMEAMCKARKTFIDEFYKGEYAQKYPNVLFEYEKRMSDLGYSDAYNHWILLQGDVTAFDAWKATHTKEYNAFTQWFVKNPLILTDQEHFVRMQYH